MKRVNGLSLVNMQKIGHTDLKEFHYDFQMTLLPITENGVEALPINVRFGTEEIRQSGSRTSRTSTCEIRN